MNGPSGFLYKGTILKSRMRVTDFLDKAFGRPQLDVVLNDHLVAAYAFWAEVFTGDSGVDDFGPGNDLGES